MASQATRQRKGAAVGGPKSGEALVEVSNAIAETFSVDTSSAINVSSPLNNNGSSPSNNITIPSGGSQQRHAHLIATVKRNKYGTGPFDENWLNLDCCGIVCAIITYMLHIYGVYATCLILIPPWMSYTDDNGIRTISLMGQCNRLAFTTIAMLAIYAHYKAMTTDPGAVPPDAQPIPTIDEITTTKEVENGNGNNNDPSSSLSSSALMQEDPLLSNGGPPKRKGKRLCRRCNAFKPKRAHHCSICKRCIIKMDHHCPWVNNCVGIGNHKYFLLFVFYTCLSCIYSLTLIGIRFFDCMSQHGHVRTHHITCLDRPTQLLNILGLFIEAILFGLFTCCMMIDQGGVVMTKMTHIDRLKGGDDVGSSLAGVVEVFGLNPKKLELGERFRTDWLSPFHRICFPSSLQDEIMGFCRPCGGGSSAGSGTSSNRGTPMNSDRENEMAPMIRSVQEIV